MKTWEVQVYKRQAWQNGTYYLSNVGSGSLTDQTIYEYVEADYFDTLPNNNIILWNGDKKSLPVDENGATQLCWQAVDIVAAYHGNQWLSIKEWKNEEDGTELESKTV